MDSAQPANQTAPKLYRFGQKLLAHVGSIRVGPEREVPVWRDMTIAEQFVTAKYQPHQGAKECARRLRQVTAP